MIKRVLGIIGFCLCLGLSAHAATESAVAPDVGDVFGYVLSATDDAPIVKSKVRLVPAPGENVDKRSGGETDQNGLFALRSQIGNISSSIDAGRIDQLSIASILSGGAKKVEKFVAVSQIVVEVSAPGFQPFYAPVAVSSALADEKHFSVRLQPIYLAPENAGFRSYSADYPAAWKASKFGVTPLLANSGDTVKLAIAAPTIVLAMEPDDNPYIYFSLTSGNKNVISFQKVLTQKNTRPDEGVFEREFKLGSNVLPGIERVSVPRLPDTYFAVGAPAAVKDDVAALVAQLNTLGQYDHEGRDKIWRALLEMWPESAATVNYYRVDDMTNKEEALQLVRQLGSQKKGSMDKRTEASLLIGLGRMDEAMKVIGKDKSLLSSLDFQIEYHRLDLAKMRADVIADPTDYRTRSQLLRFVGEDNERAALGAIPQPQTAEEARKYADFVFSHYEQIKPTEADVRAAAALIAKDQDNSKAQLSALQLLWKAGLVAEATPVAETILSNPKSPQSRQFLPLYVRALSQWEDPLRARETLGQALQFARSPMVNLTAAPSKVLLGGASYDLYDNPLLSSGVGYSNGYAKAAALLYLYAPTAQNPQQDWLATTILARALALSQQPEKGIALLSQIADKSEDEPQFWLARAWCALAANDKPMAAKCLEKVKSLNPKDPELAQMQ